MANKYVKPSNLKYTDLCIYIDEHLEFIKNTGEYPAIESKIYEYLYHILYALALKANYFKNFADYDEFALYGASELFMSMRRKQQTAGQEVRGKIVTPIKSCLNFIKSVMFPLKINYERQSFALIYCPEVGHDTMQMAENMRESVQASYRNSLQNDLLEISKRFPVLLWDIVKMTPYRNQPIMCHRIYISCQLTFLNSLVLSKKNSKKVEKYLGAAKDKKIAQSYQENGKEVILWHLPTHMKDYIHLLVVELKHHLSDELEELRSATDLSDEVIDDVLNSAYDARIEIEEDS